MEMTTSVCMGYSDVGDSFKMLTPEWLCGWLLQWRESVISNCLEIDVSWFQGCHQPPPPSTIYILLHRLCMGFEITQNYNELARISSNFCIKFLRGRWRRFFSLPKNLNSNLQLLFRWTPQSRFYSDFMLNDMIQ